MVNIGGNPYGITTQNYLGCHEIAPFTLYTSVDLIPAFRTEPIPVRAFVKASNSAMLEVDHPDEWYDILKKYLSTYKVLLKCLLLGGFH